jgi:hypothetical protein
MKLTHANLVTRSVLALAFGLGAAATAVAQKPAHPAMPAHMAGGHAAAGQAATTHDKDTFQGIAKKLNTTQDALESAYQAALQANPKLTRGQFVAANMLAHNLGSKNPAITTDAILAGLKSGKSIGQTLQSLGMSEKEAKEAEQAADQEAREAAKSAT